MKSTFDYHHKEDEDEIKELWKNGTFIFDTNVLLNLYRYKKETAEKLFEVIENLRGRIWIPYHIGMEFHKNRLSTIADQTGKFSTVKSAIDKIRSTSRSSIEELKIRKRHSLINIEDFSERIEKLLNEFDKDLGMLKENQQGVTGKDPILDKIHSLFDGRVGIAPSQKEIDAIYADGVTRYKYKRPPGYKDIEKGEKDADLYCYAGIFYKGRYGDLVAWKQIMAHAKEENLETIIFITDDGKEDWWLQVESMGKKTIGPRLELIHEIKNDAGVKKFLMYQTEQFLSFANDYLNAKISEKEISEVREVTLEQKNSKITPTEDVAQYWENIQGIVNAKEERYVLEVDKSNGRIIHKERDTGDLCGLKAVHYDDTTDFEEKLMNQVHLAEKNNLKLGHTKTHIYINFNNAFHAMHAARILNEISYKPSSKIIITIGATFKTDNTYNYITTGERVLS